MKQTTIKKKLIKQALKPKYTYVKGMHCLLCGGVSLEPWTDDPKGYDPYREQWDDASGQHDELIYCIAHLKSVIDDLKADFRDDIDELLDITRELSDQAKRKA